MRRATAQKGDQCCACHEDNRVSKVIESAEKRTRVEAPDEPRTPARNPAVRTTRKRASASALRAAWGQRAASRAAADVTRKRPCDGRAISMPRPARPSPMPSAETRARQMPRQTTPRPPGGRRRVRRSPPECAAACWGRGPHPDDPIRRTPHCWL
ncbi:hypothetical protein MTO96_012012 [Rhipicephalus appendiculatus]